MKQDTLAGELASMADGLRGSMWADRNEIIRLLDKAAAALRTDGEANSRAVPSGEAVEPGPNAAYPWQVYCPSDPHGNYDIGGPPLRVGDHDGGFCCIATVFGGKVDADYIVALHNAARAALSASKPDDASALLKEARDGLQRVCDAASGWDLDSAHLVAAQVLARIDASIGRDGA